MTDSSFKYFINTVLVIGSCLVVWTIIRQFTTGFELDWLEMKPVDSGMCLRFTCDDV
jgi:hypothetical protein